MQLHDVPDRPDMPTEYDRLRAEHQILRTDMLTGRWEQHLERGINRHIGPDRRSLWGVPEMSRCPFRSVTQQIGGVLYRTAPEVSLPDGLVREVSRAGTWQLLQHHAMHLFGLRESAIYVDHDPRNGLVLRPVPVYDLAVKADPSAPDIPVSMAWRQLRDNPETGEPEWVWEVLDVSDESAPVHQILDATMREDVTGLYYSGDELQAMRDYYRRDSDGRPYIPIAFYHAERTGRLWDPWYGVEAVMGSITVGMLLTFWIHGVRDGSFSTVVLAGLTVGGTDISDPGSPRTTRTIQVEPGAFIEAVPMDPEGGQQGQVLQLRPGFDPGVLIEAIGQFEGGLAEYAGVSPADLIRTHADPRSGISLSISRDGLRSAQNRIEPQLRRGDQQLLAVIAKTLNRATGTDYPEDADAEIAYPSLPKSADELEAERKDVIEKIEAGLMSKVEAMQRLYPHLTRDQAIARLQQIQRDNAMFPGVTI